MENIQQRLKTLQEELQTGLVGRSQAVKIALLALLAEENVLLVGPPGTAKSLLARKIAQSIQSSEEKDTVPYFEYLLTKFSTPEEIFGPLSISELKKDCFKRNTLGYLPSAQVGFLDEIFKASSSILNSLLTIMNEKLYHNGTTVVPTPLRSLIAASNELPSGQEELEALYDRFLLRQYVGYVADNDITHLINVTASSEYAAVKPLSPYELAKIKELSAHVKLSERIMQVLKEIWLKHRDAFKEDRRESLSDRRLVKVVNLLKVSAATNGRNDVDLSDMLLLIHCLWNHPDNATKVNEIIVSVIKRYSSQTSKIESLYSDNQRSQSESANVAANNKIKGMQGSGTEYDPFIIRNAADFIYLEREEIGCAGYFFSQVSDVDLSALSYFDVFPFQGEYRGNGYVIKCNDRKVLFDSVKDGSEVSGVFVKNGSVTMTAVDSLFYAITTDYRIVIGEAERCIFRSCSCNDSIVGSKANHCTLSECVSNNPLISRFGGGDDIDVKDCVVNLCENKVHNGCVLNTSANNSRVRNIFIFSDGMTLGYNDGRNYMSGVASWANGSDVSGCVVGELNVKGSFKPFVENVFGDSYDCWHSSKDNVLKNNYVSLSNLNYRTSRSINNKPNHQGVYGGVIIDEMFNQYFFENTLGWDFDSIWQWNSQHNRPELQRVGVAALKKTSASIENEQSQTPLPVLNDELIQNIWLES
nr:AAA family ATPase [Plesiomonas shigelloides]